MNAEIRIESSDPSDGTGSARALRRIAVFAAVTLLSTAGFGCFGASSAPEEPSLSDPRLRGERIEELKEAIERDHAALEDLITRPESAGDVPLHDDPDIREIAARLTEQERALQHLQQLEAAAEDAEK